MKLWQRETFCLAVAVTCLLYVPFSLSNAKITASLNIAVASNFIAPMRKLVEQYQRDSNTIVKLSIGSSGSLHAQIANGAPFQLFFSADQEKPEALVESGIASKDSKITYAIGKLRLWTLRANADPLDMLVSGSFSKMALANPLVAPYGEAADAVLKSLGLKEKYINRRVIGQNIAQTFLYVESGNADLGFISASQDIGTQGSVWDIPSELYKPIKQDAVLINNQKHQKQAQEFLRFIGSEQAKRVIVEYGYRTLDNH